MNMNIKNVEHQFLQVCPIEVMRIYILRSGQDNIIRLCNLQGEVITSMRTKSGHAPRGLAVTNCWDLVYTDIRGVNIVKNRKHRGRLDRIYGLQAIYAVRPSATSWLSWSKVIEKQMLSVTLLLPKSNEKGQPLYPCSGLMGISENK